MLASLCPLPPLSDGFGTNLRQALFPCEYSAVHVACEFCAMILRWGGTVASAFSKAAQKGLLVLLPFLGPL